jgi:hypothetical protein
MRRAKDEWLPDADHSPEPPMTGERRYRDDEIRRIFELASSEVEGAERSASSLNALTLGQLQEIGREVGIAPERIAQAARSLDSVATVEYRRWPFGIPIAVRRTATLPRSPTPREWDVIVSTLRETFEASGRVVVSNGIFEWRNGNLHVFIEPVAAGYRLRMGTRKGSAVALSTAGLLGLGWSLAAFIGLALSGDLAQGFLAPTLLTLIGAGSLGSAVLRLPAWARTRDQQMEGVAQQVRSLLADEPVG